VRPVEVYGWETWTMTVRDMERLDRFERKVMRKIFGPRRDEDSPMVMVWGHLGVLIHSCEMFSWVAKGWIPDRRGTTQWVDRV